MEDRLNQASRMRKPPAVLFDTEDHQFLKLALYFFLICDQVSLRVPLRNMLRSRSPGKSEMPKRHFDPLKDGLLGALPVRDNFMMPNFPARDS